MKKVSTISTNKDDLSKSIEDAFHKLISDYKKISLDYIQINEIEGNFKNTKINVSDTLSYLIGWGRLVLKWYDKKSKNLEVDFPESGFKWNELGSLAQHFYLSYKQYSYSELLLEFENTINSILKLISSLDNDELYGSNWYKNYTLGRMIQLNTSAPMKNVRTKIRKFKKVYKIDI